MADFKTFTSEEALDDYFSSLLDEEIIELVPEIENTVLPEPEITWQSESVVIAAPEPQYQPQFSTEVDDDDDYPFELPRLEDVQRLLSQLENSQLDAQIEIDALVSNSIETEQAVVEVEVEVEVEPIIQTIVETETIVEELVVEESDEEPDLSTWDISDKITVTPSSKQHIDTEEVTPHNEKDSSDETEIQLETQTGKAPPLSGLDWENSEHDNEFQVLFFEVMGVTFAVPLAQLGGIHQITELNHLIGRPDWYLGLQNNRDTKIDALDTAKWVMPQSIKNDSYKEDYQYLVMLGESKWGLACNALAGTETLTSDRIRWRETAGKRPWLSGMVKEKMCALIHVEAMITMLNAGLDIKGIE